MHNYDTGSVAPQTNEVEKKPQALRLLETMKASEDFLNATGKGGAYFDLYTLEFNDGEKGKRPLAVKIAKHDSYRFQQMDRRRQESSTAEELQLVLNDRNFLTLGTSNYPTDVEKLTKSEKIFAFLALEHRRHEKFYSPYILPATFLSYTRQNDVLGNTTFDPSTEEGMYFIEELGREGRLTENKREIIARKGDPVFMMVQDYVALGPSIFRLDRSILTDSQRQQILDFANKVEQTYQTTSFFPDETMATKSDNLCFDQNGKLWLIDTNHLDHKDHVSGANTYYVQNLRDIANNVPLKNFK